MPERAGQCDLAHVQDDRQPGLLRRASVQENRQCVEIDQIGLKLSQQAAKAGKGARQIPQAANVEVEPQRLAQTPAAHHMTQLGKPVIHHNPRAAAFQQVDCVLVIAQQEHNGFETLPVETGDDLRQADCCAASAGVLYKKDALAPVFRQNGANCRHVALIPPINSPLVQ